MDVTAQASQHPRYADRYTGELFFLEGVEGTWVELMDMMGRRSRVLATSFERAYEAQDVTTRRVGKDWELWLGDHFEGELRCTGAAYSLLLPGERQRTTCRGIYQVIVALGLNPAGSRVLGL